MQAKCAGEFDVGKLCCVLCNLSQPKTLLQMPEQRERLVLVLWVGGVGGILLLFNLSFFSIF